MESRFGRIVLLSTPPVKTSLEHLPERKREQIQAIAEAIHSCAPVEMIILFGSYARGDWVDDVASGYFSDFDIMVVVGSASAANDDELWSRINARIRALAGNTPVTLLVHELCQLNHEIKSGQYFYTDVVNEGVVLYNKNDIKLARPKTLTAEERYELALGNFEHWFQSASEFWRGAVHYAGRGLDCHAAFLMHQAVGEIRQLGELDSVVEPWHLCHSGSRKAGMRSWRGASWRCYGGAGSRSATNKRDGSRRAATKPRC